MRANIVQQEGWESCYADRLLQGLAAASQLLFSAAATLRNAGWSAGSYRMQFQSG